MYWRMRNVRPPIYEFGGQEFESLRARHFGTKRIKSFCGACRRRNSVGLTRGHPEVRLDMEFSV